MRKILIVAAIVLLVMLLFKPAFFFGVLVGGVAGYMAQPYIARVLNKTRS